MMNGEEKNGRNNRKRPYDDREEKQNHNNINTLPISLDLSLGLISSTTTPSPPPRLLQQEEDPPQLRHPPPPPHHHQPPPAFSVINNYNPSFFTITTTTNDEHQRQYIDNHQSPPPQPPETHQAQTPPGHQRQRSRRAPTQAASREGKSETVSPPFPWATNRRATVHSLAYLRSKQIKTISGEVQCKRCERKYEMEFDLERKFDEVATFVKMNKYDFKDRAPGEWLNPVLPTCRFCEQQNSVKPVISESKQSINWLFLLLGQMLGCCTLNQLKYFCKHTRNHRTGAKDRVLFLTYLSLCKQVDPNGHFERI